MGTKSFILILSLVVVTSAAGMVIRNYRPASETSVSLDNFPLHIGEWTGVRDDIAPQVLDLLNPIDIFSATYTNPDGRQVHLFFDYFSAERAFGGPHSPRNCLPGSGWIISDIRDITVEAVDRRVDASRFTLKRKNSSQVMDFWYVTSFGATSNDYVFKLYEMLGSLTFRSKDVAFVRFVTYDTPENVAALKDFEEVAVPEIYRFLPFD